ncbi:MULTISPECIES: antibiotic biosynthesis monooxygenase [unclassified Pseudonocardia]|uniref:antibiotic biosynthesis monooxygenase family protein n=1 Tax=unclassified Pseudonocardia TaxID=2619320 RepID=UPI0009F9B784
MGLRIVGVVDSLTSAEAAVAVAVKINTVRVVDAQESGLEGRFAACRAGMGGVPGFRGVQLLRPVDGGGRYFVLSWWDSDASFCDWLAHGREMAHGVSSAGLGVESELLEFEVVDLPSIADVLG